MIILQDASFSLYSNLIQLHVSKVQCRPTKKESESCLLANYQDLGPSYAEMLLLKGNRFYDYCKDLTRAIA